MRGKSVTAISIDFDLATEVPLYATDRFGSTKNISGPFTFTIKNYCSSSKKLIISCDFDGSTPLSS
ncbi:protein of unknown function [Pseudomonas mediterranea]